MRGRKRQRKKDMKRFQRGLQDLGCALSQAEVGLGNLTQTFLEEYKLLLLRTKKRQTPHLSRRSESMM